MENHKSVLNKSFDLFDDIRNYDNYGKFDFLNLLNQRTNGFDLDFMKALLSDLNLYINIELEEMISNLDPTQLDIQLKSYEISGLKIPMLKRTQRKDLSIEQKSKRKKLEKSIGELSPVIDIEAIMFPFEFYGLREFRSIIINKIKEIELSRPNKIQKTDYSLKGTEAFSQLNGGRTDSVKWKGTQADAVELIKAMIEQGSLEGTQKDIFKSFEKFFDIELNNCDQKIQKFKHRKASPTTYLDELKASLINYLGK